jgi:hypothetical protein
MRRIVFSLATTCLAFAAVTGFASPAHAGVTLGADMNVGVLASRQAYYFGGGVGGHLGYKVKLGPLAVTPELGGGYLQLGPGFQPRRIYAGGRLALRGVLQPSIHAHYGYAWIQPGVDGPAYDLGGALDLSAVVLNVGAHANFVSVLAVQNAELYSFVQPTRWVEIGLHAGVGF